MRLCSVKYQNQYKAMNELQMFTLRDLTKNGIASLYRHTQHININKTSSFAKIIWRSGTLYTNETNRLIYSKDKQQFHAFSSEKQDESPVQPSWINVSQVEQSQHTHINFLTITTSTSNSTTSWCSALRQHIHKILQHSCSTIQEPAHSWKLV